MSLNITSMAEVDVIADPHSVDPILEDQLYLGNLSAAQSLELRASLGITHVLSVCPDYPSTGPKHLTIPVDDTEREDLLVHLPAACQFIQDSLDQGGKVLVHCVMGISRSATFVCAYLMVTRQMSAPAAIRFVKQRRPRIRPNYGFIKQLQTFSACNYEPEPTNPAYITWKTKQEHDNANFLKVLDCTAVIPDRLFFSCDFPDNRENAESLLANIGITHILSISPDKFSSRPAVVGAAKHCHIIIPNKSREGLLVALPQVCEFIAGALDSDGSGGNDGTSRIIVHCLVESRACIAVCAYLMVSRNLPPGEAFPLLEDVLPLFTPTANFSRHLELFNACGFEPTPDHPLVKAWIAEPAGPPQTAVSRSDYLNILTKCKTLSRELREFLRAGP